MNQFEFDRASMRALVVKYKTSFRYKLQTIWLNKAEAADQLY